MATEFRFLLLALAGLAAVDLLVLALTFLVKRRRRRDWSRGQSLAASVRAALLARDGQALTALIRRSPRRCADLLRRTLEGVGEDGEALALARRALEESGALRAAATDTRSGAAWRRLRGYLTLGLADSAAAVAVLAGRVPRERDRLCRLVLLRQLATVRTGFELDGFAAALAAAAAPDEADYAALAPLGPRLAAFYAAAGVPADPVGRRLYLAGVAARPSEAGFAAAAAFAEAGPSEAADLAGLPPSDADAAAGAEGEALADLADRAAAVLAAAFPPSRFQERFAARREVRFMAPRAAFLGAVLKPEEADALDPWCADPRLRPSAVAAFAAIDRRFPEAADALLALLASGGADRAACLALALEPRLPYLLHHAAAPLPEGLVRLIGALVEADRVGGLLSALEAPLPEPTAAAAAAAPGAAQAGPPRPRAIFARHAGPRLRAALQLEDPPPEPNKPRIPVTAGDKLFIALLVAAALAVFPLAFVLRQGPALAYLTGAELLHRFVFDFHFLFAYYTIAVNAIYLALLILSSLELSAQARLWDSGLRHFLFSAGLLPEVTIIAPAFNEEKTIADSAESLLSLAYPRYRVVVVNDGSSDGTLAELTRVFALEPAVPGGAGTLPTMPVRTVYRSAKAPNLIVVDKANGGKADALNAGLNYARGDYVCCIDADSLLDPQALLRAMLQVLAGRRETVAIGGNIFPVNGSAVDHGHLQSIGLPTDPLAAFQTMEYLRSFVSGRLGWARLDGLLIISGAFGVFRRDRVLAVGGYMTGSGAYRKDTVGEDMELVVRLARAERESGRNGAVRYCYNANCWTEVPEDPRALGRQRDRWHRGLIEVLLQHRGMVGRPRYGAAGLLALPYFWLFELVGPWLEFSGYIVMALSLLLSLIDPFVSLVVFAVSVAFGALISLCSILMAERQVVYFRWPEFLRLALLAVVENFGFRQSISLSRAGAFVQFLYKSKGWQKFARRGFVRKGGTP
jgi:cellulose synthase/poly-beta-1,6-N-acetylglucosamine synthase-like glycosyltransferase